MKNIFVWNFEKHLIFEWLKNSKTSTNNRSFLLFAPFFKKYFSYLYIILIFENALSRVFKNYFHVQIRKIFYEKRACFQVNIDDVDLTTSKMLLQQHLRCCWKTFVKIIFQQKFKTNKKRFAFFICKLFLLKNNFNKRFCF